MPSTSNQDRDGDAIITEAFGRVVLDSRGNPTLEAVLSSSTGHKGRAIVPSGASTGTYEAIELRDNDKSRFHGKGVKKALANVNVTIARHVKGQSPFKQEQIDRLLIELDGTKNKSKLGGNAILAVSLANAYLAANIKGMHLYEYLGSPFHQDKQKWLLPVPLSNIINGGVHAGNRLAIQEFMIMPVGAQSFFEAVRMVSEVYHTLKQLLKDKYGKNATNVGDEGGFAPPINYTRDALEALVRAVEESGYGLRTDFYLALDAAANEFKTGPNKYEIDGKHMSAPELQDYYVDLVRTYPIISIEDPFQEDEFESFAGLVKKIGLRTQIVGDDLTVTNPTRIQRAIREQSMTALLLKVNQIGSLTEAINSAKLCLDNKPKGLGVIVSHRSGETEDVTISHLAVALRCGQIKIGAPARGERTAKYNELIRISDLLGDRAIYVGTKFRTPWVIT
ncbi:MAG: phosphopyruvate hydratase [Candidatus Ranarchaeia archaeon]